MLRVVVLGFVIHPVFADEKYVFYSGFAGNPVDDGTQNFEILNDLLTSATFNLHQLESENNPKHVPVDAAVLVDTMLQIRAFCSQRDNNIHLKPEQKRQVDVINQALAPLNLSYHAKERQGLVDLFIKPEYASRIESLRNFMVKSHAFAPTK